MDASSVSWSPSANHGHSDRVGASRKPSKSRQMRYSARSWKRGFNFNSGESSDDVVVAPSSSDGSEFDFDNDIQPQPRTTSVTKNNLLLSDLDSTRSLMPTSDAGVISLSNPAQSDRVLSIGNALRSDGVLSVAELTKDVINKSDDVVLITPKENPIIVTEIAEDQECLLGLEEYTPSELSEVSRSALDSIAVTEEAIDDEWEPAAKIKSTSTKLRSEDAPAIMTEIISDSKGTATGTNFTTAAVGGGEFPTEMISNDKQPDTAKVLDFVPMAWGSEGATVIREKAVDISGEATDEPTLACGASITSPVTNEETISGSGEPVITNALGSGDAPVITKGTAIFNQEQTTMLFIASGNGDVPVISKETEDTPLIIDHRAAATVCEPGQIIKSTPVISECHAAATSVAVAPAVLLENQSSEHPNPPPLFIGEEDTPLIYFDDDPPGYCPTHYLLPAAANTLLISLLDESSENGVCSLIQLPSQEVLSGVDEAFNDNPVPSQPPEGESPSPLLVDDNSQTGTSPVLHLAAHKEDVPCMSFVDETQENTSQINPLSPKESTVQTDNKGADHWKLQRSAVVDDAIPFFIAGDASDWGPSPKLPEGADPSALITIEESNNGPQWFNGESPSISICDEIFESASGLPERDTPSVSSKINGENPKHILSCLEHEGGAPLISFTDETHQSSRSSPLLEEDTSEMHMSIESHKKEDLNLLLAAEGETSSTSVADGTKKNELSSLPPVDVASVASTAEDSCEKDPNPQLLAENSPSPSLPSKGDAPLIPGTVGNKPSSQLPEKDASLAYSSSKDQSCMKGSDLLVFSEEDVLLISVADETAGNKAQSSTSPMSEEGEGAWLSFMFKESCEKDPNSLLPVSPVTDAPPGVEVAEVKPSSLLPQKACPVVESPRNYTTKMLPQEGDGSLTSAADGVTGDSPIIQLPIEDDAPLISAAGETASDHLHPEGDAPLILDETTDDQSHPSLPTAGDAPLISSPSVVSDAEENVSGPQLSSKGDNILISAACETSDSVLLQPTEGNTPLSIKVKVDSMMTPQLFEIEDSDSDREVTTTEPCTETTSIGSASEAEEQEEAEENEDDEGQRSHTSHSNGCTPANSLSHSPLSLILSLSKYAPLYYDSANEGGLISCHPTEVHGDDIPSVHSTPAEDQIGIYGIPSGPCSPAQVATVDCPSVVVSSNQGEVLVRMYVRMYE